MPPLYINSLALVANVAERTPVPAGYTFVVISSTANVYVKCGDSSVTATIPNDVSDGSGSELNPNTYVLHNSYSHMSVISPSNCIVTFGYYDML